MYYQYFGLTEAPFSIAVNPRYLYMSHRHRDALAHLLYGVGAGGTFILLTGEVGTGKTTINRCLLEQLPEDIDTAIVLNPALDAMELLATVCDELGIDYRSETGGTTLKGLTDRLHRFLLSNHERGRKTVLLIDEAQHLTFDVLGQIRLLTNLETNSEKLLHIILIGQPELAHKLARPELRQLNQRITARYTLGPLSLEETDAYIRHRLQVAGLTPGRTLFPRGIVRRIHRVSGGIPRLINLLCDRTLLGAYGRNSERVDRSTLRAAVREVTGEEHRNRWRTGIGLGVAAILALGVVLVGWWLWLQPSASTTVPPQATDATAQAVPAAPVAAAPDSPDVALASASWLLPPAEGLAALWRLHTDDPQPDDLCLAASVTALSCVTDSADSWRDLRALERPVLLNVVTQERFAASALLLSIQSDNALLATATGVERVPLAQLAPRWSGGYQYLWERPAGFDDALGPGDSGPVVAAVAALFARLDGQAEPLTTAAYSDALRERVRLFQQSEGLQADGLVGRNTLIRLQTRAGTALDGRAAVARVDDLIESGAWPS
jgi:general secretion pathway protein A